MRRLAISLLLLAAACGPTRGGRGEEDCSPDSCDARGKDCGEIDDGCGDTIDCGTCTDGATCGGGGVANVCGKPGSCTPETDAQLCARHGLQCGPVNGAPDNCGTQRTIASCGACVGELTCGGNGVANVCGKPGQSCTPETNAQFCSRGGQQCGTVTGTDNCGTPRTVESCGDCGANAGCGIVQANRCCARETAAVLCGRTATACGPLTTTNGCGESVSVSCGPCAQSGWATMASSTSRRLWEISGSSASNVWAVGEAGTVVRFDGVQWTTVPIASTANVNALAVLSPTNVIVGTQDRKLWHWDGSAWTQRTNPAAAHYGNMWVQNSTTVIAAGLNGTIIRWDGANWTREPTPWNETGTSTVPDLYDVFGSGGLNVWAVGPQQKIVRFDGTFWSEVTPPDATVGVTFVSVWGTGPNNMILFGSPGASQPNIAYRKGSTEFAAISVALSDPKGIFGVSGTNVWAVGGGGEISHWDGVEWLAHTSPTMQRLDDVWAPNATEAFAVGTGGTILHYRQ